MSGQPADLENWWVIQLEGNNGYISVESDGRPDATDSMLHLSSGITIELYDLWTGAPGRYRIAYGPCTEQEAADFIDDVSSYTEEDEDANI
jgi:uncharacterized cupin superfamily protein